MVEMEGFFHILSEVSGPITRSFGRLPHDETFWKQFGEFENVPRHIYDYLRREKDPVDDVKKSKMDEDEQKAAEEYMEAEEANFLHLDGTQQPEEDDANSDDEDSGRPEEEEEEEEDDEKENEKK